MQTVPSIRWCPSWLYQAQVDTDVGKSQNQAFQLAMLAANFLAQGMAAKSSAGAGIDDDSGLKGGSEEDEDMPSITEDQHGVLQGMHDQGFDTNFPTKCPKPKNMVPASPLPVPRLAPTMTIVQQHSPVTLLEGAGLGSGTQRRISATSWNSSRTILPVPGASAVSSQEHKLAASAFPEASIFFAVSRLSIYPALTQSVTCTDGTLFTDSRGTAIAQAPAAQRGCRPRR